MVKKKWALCEIPDDTNQIRHRWKIGVK
jgi:hypothetical protein